MSDFDVFISYSRKDDEDGFVSRMKSVLETASLNVWMDDKIVSSAEWWTQIESHIERSNNFLLLLSENSLSSEWCQKEISHALVNGKRIIAFQLAGFDERLIKGNWIDKPWEEIARKNWIALQRVQWITLYLSDRDFDAGVARIVADAQTNPLHVAMHTQLLLQAQTWQNSGRSPGAQISGQPLDEVEVWLNAWEALPVDGKILPAPTDIQRAFVAASRDAQRRAILLKEEQEARTRALELQTERAAAENLSLVKRTSRFRAATALSAVIGIFALVTTIIAITQSVDANTAKVQADTQVAVANTREGGASIGAATAEARAQGAETREAHANLSLTLVPVTLAVIDAQVTAIQATAAQIPPTLTQAAIVQSIVGEFADALLLQESNPSQQIRALDALIARYPDQPSAYISRGLAYAAQQDYIQAIADYNVAIRLDPNNSSAYTNRGLAFFQLGDLPGAINDYDYALTIDRNNVIALYYRGNAYLTGVSPEHPDPLAINDFIAAIRIDPWFSNAYVGVGNFHFAVGEPSLSISAYTQAIRINPENTIAYLARANAHCELGNFEACQSDYFQYISLGGHEDREISDRLTEMEEALIPISTPSHTPSLTPSQTRTTVPLGTQQSNSN